MIDAGGSAKSIFIILILKAAEAVFICKLLDSKNYGKCAYPDSLKDILSKAPYGYGIVFAASVYLKDATGIMKMFLECLALPFVCYDNNFIQRLFQKS